MNHSETLPSVVRASVACAPPFASVEIHTDPASIAQDWNALAPCGSGYQTQGYVTAWARAFGVELSLVVARDAGGRAVALLPLYVRRWGPLRIARFAGEHWTNYQIGAFRPGIGWTEQDARALLLSAGRQAGADLLAFTRQPERWEGVENPLSPLFGAIHSSPAFATSLGRDPQAWVTAHFSHATQKKLRKKLRKLQDRGPVQHIRARDAEQAGRFLEAMYAHRAAQAEFRGRPDALDDPRARAFLRAASDAGALEVSALLVGEQVAAVFCAVASRRRLSGVMVSYDRSPDIATSTPGAALLLEVASEARKRGLESFDLGVGRNRYKSDFCEIEEPLHDAAVGVSWFGRVAAALWIFGRRHRLRERLAPLWGAKLSDTREALF